MPEYLTSLKHTPRYRFRLPLTVAVLRSLLVEVDGERYAVPLAEVAETFRLRGQVIHQVARRGVMTWRGAVIPVVDAGRVLDTGRRGERRYGVILRVGGRHRGLLVDDLLGHQEVVVKSLDPALGRPAAVSAATILGDGRVACILDPARLTDQGAEPPALAAS